jgi:hypothetical protein
MYLAIRVSAIGADPVNERRQIEVVAPVSEMK